VFSLHSKICNAPFFYAEMILGKSPAILYLFIHFLGVTNINLGLRLVLYTLLSGRLIFAGLVLPGSAPRANYETVVVLRALVLLSALLTPSASSRYARVSNFYPAAGFILIYIHPSESVS
jgi:hypothetical protein